RAAAALLTAAHRTLFQQIMDLTLEDKDNQEIAAIVADTAHQVFDLLEPALTDYAVRTQPS
ncbi:MAG: TetR family transcriptional regulator, partial [Trebonia sp.]